jgi:hypothetical protein
MVFILLGENIIFYSLSFCRYAVPTILLRSTNYGGHARHLGCQPVVALREVGRPAPWKPHQSLPIAVLLSIAKL